MIKLLFKTITAFGIIYTMNNAAFANTIVGSNFSMLGVTTGVFSSLSSTSKGEPVVVKQVEAMCLTYALYHEARGEPVVGQYAVAATILNRVRSRAYPTTICGVVFQGEERKFKCQFSFACDGRSDVPTNVKSHECMSRIADAILTTGIAREAKFMGHQLHSELGRMTHYHRHDVEPVWSKELNVLSMFGDHVFFESERVTRRYTF